jgi:hypothetical protein
VYRADLGYHFLLSPPGPDQALATLYPGIWRQWDRERTERVKAGCTIHVMRRRILIQISLIAGVAIWLIALISIGNRLYRQSAVPQARTGPST